MLKRETDANESLGEHPSDWIRGLQNDYKTTLKLVWGILSGI